MTYDLWDCIYAALYCPQGCYGWPTYKDGRIWPWVIT